jgi:hypothetical protein
MVIHTFTDLFRFLNADFHFSLPQVQAKTIYNIRCMICPRIHSTGANPGMVQSQNYQGSLDHDDLLDIIMEELIEQPENAFNHPSCFVAPTEDSMQFSAVLPMDWSAITSSSQPIPCSNTNSNRNAIASIICQTSVENPGFVVGSTFVEDIMALGG